MIEETNYNQLSSPTCNELTNYIIDTVKAVSCVINTPPFAERKVSLAAFTGQ
jgi:hypothetical protein